MKTIVRKVFLMVILACIWADLGAKVELPAVIGDNMVLQRNTSVALWGKARPSRKVVISPSWTSVKTTVTADSDGKWSAKLQTPGAGGPFEITFSDGENLKISNILIGEVWLCSGQSNMDMNYGWGLTRGKEDIETNVYDRIRLFDDPNALSFTPLDTLSKPAEWTPCDFAHAKSFSAAGYFFAQALQRGVGFPFSGKDREHRLGDVPIGLIEATWSGSPICTWLSGEAYSGADPEFAAKYDALAKAIAEPASCKKPPQLSFWTPADYSLRSVYQSFVPIVCTCYLALYGTRFA